MPTIKQKRAAKAAAENGGIISRAMLAAGYSPMTAQDPKKLTESKAWPELMAEYLPDSELASQHEKFLHSDREEIGVKALDLAYKLKGSYAPDKSININAELKVDDVALEELARLLEKQERLHDNLEATP